MIRFDPVRSILGAALAAVVAFQAAPAFAREAPAPAASLASQDGAGPALWVVRDADSTIYLFGTVNDTRPTPSCPWPP